MTSPNIQYCIEQLCADGCQAVYGYIQNLEHGESVPYTDNLNESEKRQILAELKSVMAVYDESPDSCK